MNFVAKLFEFPNWFIIIGAIFLLITVAIGILLGRRIRKEKPLIEDKKEIEDILEDETSLEKEMIKIKRFVKEERVESLEEPQEVELEDTDPLIVDLNVEEQDPLSDNFDYVELNEDKELIKKPKKTNKKSFEKTKTSEEVEIL